MVMRRISDFAPNGWHMLAQDYKLQTDVLLENIIAMYEAEKKKKTDIPLPVEGKIIRPFLHEHDCRMCVVEGVVDLEMISRVADDVGLGDNAPKRFDCLPVGIDAGTAHHGVAGEFDVV